MLLKMMKIIIIIEIIIENYNTKVTSIEAQIAGLSKNTVDHLADMTKLKAIDTNNFVTRTKFSADTNALEDKIYGGEKNT